MFCFSEYSKKSQFRKLWENREAQNNGRVGFGCNGPYSHERLALLLQKQIQKWTVYGILDNSGREIIYESMCAAG